MNREEVLNTCFSLLKDYSVWELGNDDKMQIATLYAFSGVLDMTERILERMEENEKLEVEHDI